MMVRNNESANQLKNISGHIHERSESPAQNG